jgi:hypothetical protein
MKLTSEISYNPPADSILFDYSDKWTGVAPEDPNLFIQFMSSNDLIFVVLAVSLIIWFVLVFYLVRVDRKITTIEEKVLNKEENNSEL